MKNCPFCGGEGYIDTETMSPWEYKHLREFCDTDIDGLYYYGCCKKCGATTGNALSREEAIKLWDQRVEGSVTISEGRSEVEFRIED